MRSILVLLIAAVALAFVVQQSDAKFSFALPGKWANNKRGFRFALPGKWGNPAKRSDTEFLDCGEFDPEAIYAIYNIIQVEAMRINECMAENPLTHENEVEQS